MKALELIGKLTEVQSFTERREILNIHADASTMREKLIQSLRMALSNQDIKDVDEADELMAEITGETSIDDDYDGLVYVKDNEANIVSSDDDDVSDVKDGDGLVDLVFGETHAPPTPEICPSTGSATLHSIPLTKAPKNSNYNNVIVTIPSESNTCVSTSKNPNKEIPPLSVSNKNG